MAAPTYEQIQKARERQQRGERLAISVLASVDPARRWLDMTPDDRQRWSDAVWAVFEAGRKSERDSNLW